MAEVAEGATCAPSVGGGVGDSDGATDTRDAGADLGPDRYERRPAVGPGSQQKAGRTHGMPISKEAIAVLKQLRKLNPEGQHVFQWQGKPIDDIPT